MLSSGPTKVEGIEDAVPNKAYVESDSVSVLVTRPTPISVRVTDPDGRIGPTAASTTAQSTKNSPTRPSDANDGGARSWGMRESYLPDPRERSRRIAGRPMLSTHRSRTARRRCASAGCVN